ncbi:tripartite tricarboxylate transporter substrate binding protein [Microbacteriaceae bacterium K1510]|nr:tripartite tricarboxylate transporter substrate binding protein [Microbacteriaceae bacterium K1510]
MFGRLLLFLAFLLSFIVGNAAAQTYPDKPIRLIVPFLAGGSVDAMARLVAHQLSTRVGPVVVENRPGGGATIGARSVAGAEPDGYTLLFASAGSLCVAPALYANPGYDPLRSFVPVATVSILPPVFVVGPAVPANTIREFIAYAKANPGKLNYGAALGTPPHLAGALFKAKAEIDVAYIPYKGAAQSVADLLGGQTQFSIDSLTSYYQLIRDGKVKALAVASSSRWPDLPDVPTMIESGYADMAVDAWTAVVAPAGTPSAIVDRLNAAINDALNSPEVAAQLKQMSAIPKIGSPEDFAVFLAAETKKWSDAVKIAGAKVDGG